MAVLGRLRHRIAHFLGWNTGEVWLDTLTDECGKTYSFRGFRCHGCGQLFHVDFKPTR